MGHISKIREHRNSRRRHFLNMGVPEKNWTMTYTPELADHPRAALVPLRKRAHPTTIAHYADDGIINWPYNPASYQVFVMNGWYGNQLPGWHKRPWEDPAVNPVFATPFTQNHNPMSVVKKGEFGPQMSQKTTQGILSQVGRMWANVRSSQNG